jgi:hypothetical protein
MEIYNESSDLSYPKGDEIKELSPDSFNYELAESKGLCKGETLNDKYFMLQALYKKTFEEYLITRIDIKKFDDELKDSELKFISGREKHKSIYQKYDYMNLTFIYLINNIHVEKLDDSDLELLQTSLKQYNGEISDELIKMIEKTYQSVITITYKSINDDNDYDVLYGNTINGERRVPNNALVLEINTIPEYDKEGNYVDREKEVVKDDYIDDMIARMEEEFTVELRIPVEVLIN